MCDYLTGFIPAGDDLAEIEERLPRPLRQQLGMTFEPINNRQILSERSRGDRFVRFTGRRHCDCGISVGCRMPAHVWWWWWYYGKTKGEYSLSQDADRRWRRLLKEARRWLSLFGYLADEVRHFGLLLHWGHDLEGFTFNQTARLDLESATPEAVMLLEREVAYEVVR
jgi:hypothetical protein